MQVSSAQAAERLGISQRAALSAISDAGVVTKVGNTHLVDGLAFRLAERARADGRRWSEDTALAALELLDTNRTARLRSDARSRLRGQLRSMDAAAIAHRARTVIGRVRRVSAPRGTTRLETIAAHAAESALDDAAFRHLGLAGGPGHTRYFRMAGGETLHELTRAGVRDDSRGDIVLLVGARGEASGARALLESYMLGDSRLMSTTGRELEARARAL